MEKSFSLDQAKEVIESGIASAQQMLSDTSEIDRLLKQLEENLRDVPKVGDTLADVPLMIAMVKGYITKQYTEVSPKVIATIVSAFVYFVKSKDLISDDLPLVGRLDDIAVLGLALKLCEHELKAFAAFRDGTSQA